MSDEMILMSDDAAATYRTDIAGWVSRRGIFYGDDERTARYDGATHRACEDCGIPVEKSHLVCDGCGFVRDLKRWQALPVEEWKEGPATLFRGDEYFFDEDEFFEWCENNEVDPASQMLQLCAPCRPREIDTDYFDDCLGEDEDWDCLPDEVREAAERFNDAIKNCPPMMWFPRHARIDMEALCAKVLESGNGAE